MDKINSYSKNALPTLQDKTVVKVHLAGTTVVLKQFPTTCCFSPVKTRLSVYDPIIFG